MRYKLSDAVTYNCFSNGEKASLFGTLQTNTIIWAKSVTLKQFGITVVFILFTGCKEHTFYNLKPEKKSNYFYETIIDNINSNKYDNINCKGAD